MISPLFSASFYADVKQNRDGKFSDNGFSCEVCFLLILSDLSQ